MNYLLRDTDHTGAKRGVPPLVLGGSPTLTIQCIDSIARKYKYVSGAIAFRDCERPTRDQLQGVIRAFKATMCPGLAGHEFNSLFVLHEEPGGGCHVHFVVPMVEFRSGQRRQLNVHPPGQDSLRLYEAFTQLMNHQLGYEQVQRDPLKLALSDFERRTVPGKAAGKEKGYLHRQVTREIRRGAITDRNQLCAFLTEQYGVDVTRKGADYLALRFPGEAKARRFRGPLYEHGADYRQLVRESNVPKPFLTEPEVRQVQHTLTDLVASRRMLYEQRFKSKEFRRPHGRAGQVGDTTTTTKETRKMKQTNQPNPVVQEALRVIAEVSAGRVASNTSRMTAPNLNLPNVLAMMEGMRREATMTTTEKAHHAAMDAIHDIEAALGNLQDAINAATADIGSAKNPAQRASAEGRLARLMEQKRRLEMQLGQARVRQLNAPSGSAPR